jgi:hypothetical protein
MFAGHVLEKNDYHKNEYHKNKYHKNEYRAMSSTSFDIDR